MVISDYYRNLTDEDKSKLRTMVISEIGFSLPTFYYKIRNESFKPLERRAIESIINRFKDA